MGRFGSVPSGSISLEEEEETMEEEADKERTSVGMGGGS